jgi:non-ribosomal peptide synthetase component F
VPISHANVGHFLAAIHDRYRFTPQDRFSQTFELTFDLAMFDLFAAWGAGAAVCAASRLQVLQPARYVNRAGITVWFSVPSVIAAAQARGLLPARAMPSLRWSLFCGEALPTASARAWAAAAPNAVLENLYGPTEMTIACTAHRWSDENGVGSAGHMSATVPIGSPLPGVEHVVMGSEGPSDEGELWLSGPQMFAGYLDPSHDRGRFGDYEGVRWYRTGDRVRLLPDRILGFLGRQDDQVKILGHRVELGEVEHLLREQPGISDAAAVDCAGPEGTQIAAFYVGSEYDSAQLRTALRRRAPEYLVPTWFVRLPSLPLTPHGKVDRVTLRAAAQERAALPRVAR